MLFFLCHKSFYFLKITHTITVRLFKHKLKNENGCFIFILSLGFFGNTRYIDFIYKNITSMKTI